MVEEKNTPEENFEDKGKLLVEWEFPEFTKYLVSKRWYMIMSIVTVLLVFFGIFTQSYIFLLIIVLYISIIAIRHRRDPRIIDFLIFEDGIQVGESTFYEWKDIDKFWIIYEPPEVKNLYFKFDMPFRPDINIPLQDQNPVEIRNLLQQYAQEDIDKENESFSDGLTRLMKL